MHRRITALIATTDIPRPAAAAGAGVCARAALVARVAARVAAALCACAAAERFAAVLAGAADVVVGVAADVAVEGLAWVRWMWRE